MGITELLFLSAGLAMDAFAVSVCKGLVLTKNKTKYAFIIAALFGGFQALMPLIGWLLGSRFSGYITKFDHWIAFVLLAFIGGKMIYEAISSGGECDECKAIKDSISIKELFMLAIATSIDALAVGITFALMPGTSIWLSVSVIGVVTFVISLVGVFIGDKFGTRFKSKAELIGGIILVAIGLKILLVDLGIF